MNRRINRRQMLLSAGAAGAGTALAAFFPAWAQPVSAGIVAPLPAVSGSDITLRIARQTMTIDGQSSQAIGVNGTVPAPLNAFAKARTFVCVL